jgi:hypothetical protein
VYSRAECAQDELPLRRVEDGVTGFGIKIGCLPPAIRDGPDREGEQTEEQTGEHREGDHTGEAGFEETVRSDSSAGCGGAPLPFSGLLTLGRLFQAASFAAEEKACSVELANPGSRTVFVVVIR